MSPIKPNRPDSASKRKLDVSKRPKTRDLVRWSPEKDVKILLAIHEICKIKRINLPYDEIASQIAPHCTGNALGQHLDKLYKKVLVDSPENAPDITKFKPGINGRALNVTRTSFVKKRKERADSDDSDDESYSGEAPEAMYLTPKTPKAKSQKAKKKAIKMEDSDSDFELMAKASPLARGGKQRGKRVATSQKAKFNEETEDEANGEESEVEGDSPNLIPYDSRRNIAGSAGITPEESDHKSDESDEVESDEESSKMIVFHMPRLFLEGLGNSPFTGMENGQADFNEAPRGGSEFNYMTMGNPHFTTGNGAIRMGLVDDTSMNHSGTVAGTNFQFPAGYQHLAGSMSLFPDPYGMGMASGSSYGGNVMPGPGTVFPGSLGGNYQNGLPVMSGALATGSATGGGNDFAGTFSTGAVAAPTTPTGAITTGSSFDDMFLTDPISNMNMDSFHFDNDPSMSGNDAGDLYSPINFNF